METLINPLPGYAIVNRKSKGSNAERELVNMFWSAGWASVRVAGSGSMPHPSPDVLAGKGNRHLVIECKSTKEIKKYLEEKQMDELAKFAAIFGAEPWVGVRFDVLKWYFLSLDDLQKTPGGYVVSIQLAKQKGLNFNELIGNF